MGEEGTKKETVRPTRRFIPDAALRDTGTKVVPVLGQDWVFQQMLGQDLKRLERRARNPRTREVDGDKLLNLWYDSVVLGLADEDGNLIPNTKVPYSELSAPALNAFEAELSSFLGYTG